MTFSTKEKKTLGPLGCTLEPSHWLCEIFIPKPDHHLFSPELRDPFLRVWVLIAPKIQHLTILQGDDYFFPI
jgi:hypothetical protein